MPVLPVVANTTKVRTMVSEALMELGWLAPGENLAPEDGAIGLSKLNQLIDLWNSKGTFIYSIGFQLFTLVPNLAPHTIGPTGTFIQTIRPVIIEGAAVIVNGVDVPLNTHVGQSGDEWWAEQGVKTISSTLPTDVYYSPDWPNGNLYFWPIPTVAYQVRLELWQSLAQYATINDSVSLPQAYIQALTLSLAEVLAPTFAKAVNPQTEKAARKARAAIVSNNSRMPVSDLIDSGLQPSSGRRPYFNWLVGPYF